MIKVLRCSSPKSLASGCAMRKDSVIFKRLAHWGFDDAEMSIWTTHIILGVYLRVGGKCRIVNMEDMGSECDSDTLCWKEKKVRKSCMKFSNNKQRKLF